MPVLLFCLPSGLGVQSSQLSAPPQQNACDYAYTVPHAFSVSSVPDWLIDDRRAELVTAVKRGAIFLFRAWFDDTYNAKVKSICQEKYPKG